MKYYKKSIGIFLSVISLILMLLFVLPTNNLFLQLVLVSLSLSLILSFVKVYKNFYLTFLFMMFFTLSYIMFLLDPSLTFYPHSYLNILGVLIFIFIFFSKVLDKNRFTQFLALISLIRVLINILFSTLFLSGFTNVIFLSFDDFFGYYGFDVFISILIFTISLNTLFYSTYNKSTKKLF